MLSCLGVEVVEMFKVFRFKQLNKTIASGLYQRFFQLHLE